MIQTAAIHITALIAWCGLPSTAPAMSKTISVVPGGSDDRRGCGAVVVASPIAAVSRNAARERNDVSSGGGGGAPDRGHASPQARLSAS
jgi:hypothetical protein